MKSKIVIIGPGAIGSLFAALLARGGHNATLLDHNQKRAEERNAAGITIVKQNTTWHTPIKSCSNASPTGIADIVFVCTKAYDTKNAVKLLPPITDKNTIIISLQNGIGNAEQIAAYAPRHTLCATTAMAALRESSNTIHWTGNGTTQLAQFAGGDDTKTIATLLTGTGIKCQVLHNAQSMLWGKLIINAAINPVTAIYNITNGDLLKTPEALEQALSAAKEAEAVATALDIPLPYTDTTAAVTETCKITASNWSSMLQDIKHHRRTEIDSITGAIITEATRLNIPVPTNQILYDLLHNTNNRTVVLQDDFSGT